MIDMKDHLAAHTEKGNHYNHWPLELTLVENIHPDGSPKDCYDLGEEIGRSDFARSVWFKMLPLQARAALSSSVPNMHENSIVPVWFGWDRRFVANGPVIGTPNVRALFPPRWKAGYAEFKGLILILGCAHDFRSVKKGNCWHKMTCQKCNYSYEVDSGD